MGRGVDIPMVYRPPYPIQLLTFNAVYSWLYGPGQSIIDQVRIVTSRLKLNVNNCLLNNKVKILLKFWNMLALKFYKIFEILKFYYPLPIIINIYWTPSLPMIFWPPYPWYIDPLPMVCWPPYPWYIDPPTHGISTPLPMAYWPPYPWYIDPLSMVYRLPNHGISMLLPMVFWPPCPCNIEPPTYGISNPLLWYYELSFGRNEGGFKIQWQKLTPGSKYHKENWTRGQNIIGKSTPGSILPSLYNRA
jgi:hypothetical protein